MPPLAESFAAEPAAWAAAVLAAGLFLLRGRRAAPDRRADDRRPVGPVPVWLLDEAGAVAGRALVLDRSARGVRLAVADPLPVGAVVRLFPVDPPAGAAPAAAAVRWCRRGGRRAEVGCRFTAPPPTPGRAG